MENREAIEILKNMKWSITTKFNAVNNSTKALDMAISALEKQEIEKCCETCKYKSRSSQEIPCCDCYIASCYEDCYEPYTEKES